MKVISSNLLIDLVTNKKSTLQLEKSEWCDVVALSRQLGFLPFLYQISREENTLTLMPMSVASQLKSAYYELLKQHDSINWHLLQLRKNNPGDLKITLLKGAAYIMAGKKNAKYRLLSDIDLLVEKNFLDDAEFWLFINGFAVSVSDEYDDYYYRQWMHELPPFVNSKSGLVVDLHHNLLPISSKRHINASLIVDNGVELEQNLIVPNDEDLIIHSAVHLIQDSVFNRSLRDLCDQYWLLKDFIEQNGTSASLLERAKSLSLGIDLAKSLSLMSEVLGRSLSTEELAFVGQMLRRKRLWIVEKKCYVIMLHQPVVSEWKAKHHAASLYLFVKSHLIKMPIKLLVKHAVIKSYKRIIGLFKKQEKSL
ncbi:conserved hypothetical protein [Alteromonas infernus]